MPSFCKSTGDTLAVLQTYFSFSMTCSSLRTQNTLNLMSSYPYRRDAGWEVSKRGELQAQL